MSYVDDLAIEIVPSAANSYWMTTLFKLLSYLFLCSVELWKDFIYESLFLDAILSLFAIITYT
jgi:hypothetical protein